MALTKQREEGDGTIDALSIFVLKQPSSDGLTRSTRDVQEEVIEAERMGCHVISES